MIRWYEYIKKPDVILYNNLGFCCYRYKITIEKNYKKNATIREYVWCMSVPPRCSKYRTVVKDEIKVEVSTFL